MHMLLLLWPLLRSAAGSGFSLLRRKSASWGTREKWTGSFTICLLSISPGHPKMQLLLPSYTKHRKGEKPGWRDGLGLWRAVGTPLHPALRGEVRNVTPTCRSQVTDSVRVLNQEVLKAHLYSYSYYCDRSWNTRQDQGLKSLRPMHTVFNGLSPNTKTDYITQTWTSDPLFEQLLSPSLWESGENCTSLKQFQRNGNQGKWSSSFPNRCGKRGCAMQGPDIPKQNFSKSKPHTHCNCRTQ